MYQYILFDLDGTLTDSREGITKSVQYALRAFGIEEPDLQKLEHFIGPPLKEEMMKSYGFSEEEGVRAVEKYRERFSVTGWKENILFPYVPTMLRRLKADGRKLAVASSKPEIFVRKILDLFEVTEFFDCIVGSELSGSRTNKAEVITEAIAQLEAKEERGAILMVGDRLHDVEGARENHISCAGLTLGFGGREELELAGADYIMDSLEELTRFICEEGKEDYAR